MYLPDGAQCSLALRGWEPGALGDAGAFSRGLREGRSGRARRLFWGVFPAPFRGTRLFSRSSPALASPGDPMMGYKKAWLIRTTSPKPKSITVQSSMWNRGRCLSVYWQLSQLNGTCTV